MNQLRGGLGQTTASGATVAFPLVASQGSTVQRSPRLPARPLALVLCDSAGRAGVGTPSGMSQRASTTSTRRRPALAYEPTCSSSSSGNRARGCSTHCIQRAHGTRAAAAPPARQWRWRRLLRDGRQAAAHPLPLRIWSLWGESHTCGNGQGASTALEELPPRDSSGCAALTTTRVPPAAEAAAEQGRLTLSGRLPQITAPGGDGSVGRRRLPRRRPRRRRCKPLHHRRWWRTHHHPPRRLRELLLLLLLLCLQRHAAPRRRHRRGLPRLLLEMLLRRRRLLLGRWLHHPTIQLLRWRLLLLLLRRRLHGTCVGLLLLLLRRRLKASRRWARWAGLQGEEPTLVIRGMASLPRHMCLQYTSSPQHETLPSAP